MKVWILDYLEILKLDYPAEIGFVSLQKIIVNINLI